MKKRYINLSILLIFSLFILSYQIFNINLFYLKNIKFIFLKVDFNYFILIFIYSFLIGFRFIKPLYYRKYYKNYLLLILILYNLFILISLFYISPKIINLYYKLFITTHLLLYIIIFILKLKNINLSFKKYEYIDFFILIYSILILNIYYFYNLYDKLTYFYKSYNLYNLLIFLFLFYFSISAFLFFKMRKIKFNINFHRNYIFIILLFLLFIFFYNYSIYRILNNNISLKTFFINNFYNNIRNIKSKKLFFFFIINIQTGIIEELIFRQFLFEYLKLILKKPLFYITLNILFFIFYHAKYLYSGFSVLFLILSISYALIYYKYRNILLNSFIHGIYNFLISFVSF